MNKLEFVTDYIKKSGGAIEFHILNDLCISTLTGKLTKVIECHPSVNFPFGVMDVEISEEEIELVYNHIKN